MITYFFRHGKLMYFDENTGRIMTPRECYDCGQKIKCTAYVSIDYQFSVKDPVDEVEYNVGVTLDHIRTDPSRHENYIPHLEDEDDWEDINRILTEQEVDE